jgi:hypothetical protein
MGFNLKRSSTVAQQNSGDRIQESGVRSKKAGWGQFRTEGPACQKCEKGEMKNISMRLSAKFALQISPDFSETSEIRRGTVSSLIFTRVPSWGAPDS